MVTNCKKLESHDNTIHNIASNKTALYRIKLATDCFVLLERFLAIEILVYRDAKHLAFYSIQGPAEYSYEFGG